MHPLMGYERCRGEIIKVGYMMSDVMERNRVIESEKGCKEICKRDDYGKSKRLFEKSPFFFSVLVCEWKLLFVGCHSMVTKKLHFLAS